MENQTPEVVLLSQKPKPNLALWVVVGIAILAAGIGIGLTAGKYFQLVSSSTSVSITPSPLISSLSPSTAPVEEGDQIGSWETHQDIKGKYQFSYPSNMILNQGNPNQLYNYDIKTAPGRSFDPEEDREKIKIEIYTTPEIYESLNKYLEQQKVQARDLYGDETSNKYETISLGGQKAIKSVSNIDPMSIVIFVLNPTTKQVHSIAVMPRYDIHKTIVDQILSTFKFTGGKPLNSTFSAVLPDPLQLMQSSTSIATYGFDNFEYLTITNIPTINVQSLRPSTECNQLSSGQFCLNGGKGWGQAKDVADITIGGIPAKSFYISGGVDNAYHVVQTTNAPVLEFKMYVAGGGLDQRFQNFLATVKFL